jgi:preprotein translocase subunit SecF
VQHLLSRGLVLHEDAPQFVGDLHGSWCALIGEWEGDEIPEGGVEVLLVVVVGAWLYLFPPFRFLFGTSSIIYVLFSKWE